jgi:hypothetical protein
VTPKQKLLELAERKGYRPAAQTHRSLYLTKPGCPPIVLLLPYERRSWARALRLLQASS